MRRARLLAFAVPCITTAQSVKVVRRELSSSLPILAFCKDSPCILRSENCALKTIFADDNHEVDDGAERAICAKPFNYEHGIRFIRRQ